MELLELKTVTKIENSTYGLIEDQTLYKRRLMNWKINQQKITRLNYREDHGKFLKR